MLSKKDVIRVARTEEMVEGCKASSEFSWKLHEAFFLHYKYFRVRLLALQLSHLQNGLNAR